MNNSEIGFIGSGCNVLSDVEFKQRMRNVFHQVSGYLTNTFGPYGSTTIIEKLGSFHITKDGWSVLKNLRFAHPVDNTALQIIQDIAARVVVKVGDGSTSAIVAANAILEELEKCELLTRMRSADFINKLMVCVEEINKRLLQNAKQINKTLEDDDSMDEIFRLALISTNNNFEIANMIANIYRETKNPTIDYVISKTNKTYSEIIDGYKLPFLSYIDTIFINNENYTCEVQNPLFLMTNFTIELTDDKIKKMFTYAMMRAKEENRKLVLVAPHYDKYTMENVIKRSVMSEIHAYGSFNTVYARASCYNNLSEVLYNDFAILTGGSLLTMGDFVDFTEEKDLFELVERVLGRADKLSLSKDDGTISGFTHTNKAIYDAALFEARRNYNNIIERDMQKSIISPEAFDLKKRVAKLACKMGVVHVGGGTEIAKESNKDLVEDAIKACECAYNYGYNAGGNLSIVRVVDGIIRDISDDKIDVDVDSHDFYLMIRDAFINVFKILLSNKYKADFQDSDTIISAILEEMPNKTDEEVYDLIKEEWSTHIINPCYTDIEILNAATTIISRIVSSNQYVSVIIKEAN
jgi:chaperonin GroEL